MNFIGFVGPALRLASKGMGLLANKSDDNPKTAAFLTVFGALAGWVGVDPTTLHAVGKVLVTLGTVLQGIQ